jgi:ornithine cyclodeaminase/alanine dehydrogenase-like protein (mu-crystallin family)
MQIVSAEELDRRFNFPDLVEALRQAFRRGVVTPVRHHHEIALPGEPAATLLLMPAWDDPAISGPSEGYLGVKIVTIFPGNAARGRPSVEGSYLLMAGATGEPLALIEG